MGDLLLSPPLHHTTHGKWGRFPSLANDYEAEYWFVCFFFAQSKVVHTGMHCGCILGLQISIQKLFTYTDGFQTRIFSL